MTASLLDFLITASLLELCMMTAAMLPYWSLDHLHALMPQFIDGPCNVHFVFLLDLFKNNINTYECTSSPHSSTACNIVNADEFMYCTSTPALHVIIIIVIINECTVLALQHCMYNVMIVNMNVPVHSNTA